LRLLRLEHLKWQVLSVVDSNDVSVIENYISNCNDQGVAGFISLFERFAEHGHDGFNIKQKHEVDKGESIYQFRKGDHRVLFFSCENKAIIVSCPHRKGGRAVDPKEVKKAIKIKNLYLKDKAKNTVIIFDEEEE
jgi:hypothetical protein